jgi:recombination protein RecT
MEQQKTLVATFKGQLGKYEQSIVSLLGSKYGISAEEFMVKCVNSIKKNPELLKCTPASLFGSIMYFAEIGLPFNTPEGFGYILPYKNKGVLEATPIIGYKGLVEIAYRNPKMKSIRIQAVYENDTFDYQYGTQEFISHKPTMSGDRGKLTCVYAIAKMEGIEPLFVVVNKAELDRVQKLSKSGGSDFSPYNNGTDVFNIMQSKVAIKLLFKTLPKTDNEALIKVLEMDNKLDYEKFKIRANEEGGYDLEEEQKRTTALEQKEVGQINVQISDKLKEKLKV